MAVADWGTECSDCGRSDQQNESANQHSGCTNAGKENKMDDELLTPSEVAAMFRVDAKTITRWAKAGKLNSFRTLGGHRRYKKAEIVALISNQGASE